MQDTSAASRDGAILVELEILKFHNHRDLLMVENAMLVRIYEDTMLNGFEPTVS